MHSCLDCACRSDSAFPVTHKTDKIGIFVQLLMEIKHSCLDCASRSDSAFPVIHKTDKIGIFVQLLMEINWKQLRGGGNYVGNCILSRIASRIFRF